MSLGYAWNLIESFSIHPTRLSPPGCRTHSFRSRSEVRRMISRAETIASSALRDVLSGQPIRASIDAAPRFSECLGALEWFVPSVLGQLYKHWERYEDLDGFRIAKPTKTAERQVELIGMCCLIQDQTWTPVHLQLRHAPARPRIEWMTCRIGARGEGHGGLLRIPHRALGRKDPYRVAEDPERVDWAYSVTFGDEDPA